MLITSFQSNYHALDLSQIVQVPRQTQEKTVKKLNQDEAPRVEKVENEENVPRDMRPL